jgi:hypothetical protein
VHFVTAITRSRWHQYKRGEDGPFPGATALCGMQDSTQGSGGLINWAVNGALETYARTLQQTDDWDEARAAAAAWPNNARDLGSDVHTAVDQFNRGLPLEITNETAPYVAQYAAWLRNAGVEIVASEFYTINGEYGFGGTLDAIARIDGELCLVDWKTGKAKDSQRLQLAGLSMAEWYGDKGKDAEPMPKIETAYIALLRPDGPPELIRHDITDADREHFLYLVDTYHRVRDWAKAFNPTPVQIKEEAA